MPSSDSSGFRILNMFNRESRPTSTESVVESADSGIESADSTTDSAENRSWVHVFLLCLLYVYHHHKSFLCFFSLMKPLLASGNICNRLTKVLLLIVFNHEHIIFFFLFDVYFRRGSYKKNIYSFHTTTA